MYKVTWRDVYGEIWTDYVVMNESEPKCTEKGWKKAAEEIIKAANGGNVTNIIETTKVKHDNIYVAVIQEKRGQV